MICICVVKRLIFERRLYRLLRFYRCYGPKARPKLIQHQNQSVSKRLNNHSSCRYLNVLAQHCRDICFVSMTEPMCHRRSDHRPRMHIKAPSRHSWQLSIYSHRERYIELNQDTLQPSVITKVPSCRQGSCLSHHVTKRCHYRCRISRSRPGSRSRPNGYQTDSI